MAQITLNSTGVASDGALVLQSNGTTTAVTISTAQVATLAKDAVVNGLTVGRGAGAVSTNTAVGSGAMAGTNTGGGNVGVGISALAVNTGGDNNTAVGNSALAANTNAQYNTAIGSATLLANTTGANNTAIGRSALISNTTASNNTAVGYQAGYTGTTGNNNCFFGQGAGYSNNNQYNTFIGRLAGRDTTGTTNTFVGDAAGVVVTSGSKNTILGAYNGNQGGLDIRTASNYIVLSDGDGTPWASLKAGTLSLAGTSASDIGGVAFKNNANAKSWGIAANTSDFFITNAGFTTYAALVSQSFTAWTFSSDRRIKTDIVDIEYGLDAVMAIKPRKYKMLASGETSIGFVAQELKEVVPEAVTGEEIEYLDTDTPQEKASKTMGVSKDLLIPVLVKAIQELKAEFDAYKEAHP
jgi:hypothetical protein